ncbi:hypothetical protein B0O99DRAFT_621755 [Bisporella sp. PMI_857]|nr:hypothetical protein B0O99DRAFT_621755 [Bisporella sp. PMI_857]
MVIINLILLIHVAFMYGLQRLCYGPLRPIEIEQLYEKGWFAVTETCLAMTIFREEVGAWFLVMFVALLTGKVWGWIGDGRVEVLEQQPPANPRLFHIRLSISLGISILYDTWLMSYIINTVIAQARPNMMVMFLFEFAILTTMSMSTGCRYAISLIEARVTSKQMRERLVERRREVRQERDEILRSRETAIAEAAAEGKPTPEFTEPLPDEEDVDEMDIEVPGWEAKGSWILTLALCTDFLKLAIYCTFFFILLMFYGLPIHILRDLFMTTRSFVMRLNAFLRYRQATKNMNNYPDATVEDIQREDTCIICREEMRPWSVTNPDTPPAAPGAPPPVRPAVSINESKRPKKLPCGHVLHLNCLKSWLERQQVCPTCREPVMGGPNQARRAARNNANPAGAAGQPPAGGEQNDNGGLPQPPAAGQGNRGLRVLNFGPLRVGFGQANLQDLQNGQGGQNAIPPGARVYGLELGFPRRQQAQPQGQVPLQGTATTASLQDQIHNISQQIMAEVQALNLTQQQLQMVQLLHTELERLRLLQQGLTEQAGQVQIPTFPSTNLRQTAAFTMPHMQRLGARQNTSAIPAGSADLPPGVTIPEGWSLLPLQRLDEVSQTGTVPAVTPTSGLAPTATTIGIVTSPTSGTSNNTPLPQNLGNQTPATVFDSSDRSATFPPRSAAADQSAFANPNLPETSLNGSNEGSAPQEHEAGSLPNWGQSQLFSGQTFRGDTNGTTPPPQSGEAQNSASTLDRGHSSSVDVGGGSSEADSEERRREKGKGRAVMVEDVDDESGPSQALRS